jgi:signal transduction protein with GAF and PtsI domain
MFSFLEFEIEINQIIKLINRKTNPICPIFILKDENQLSLIITQGIKSEKVEIKIQINAILLSVDV